jgi:predicted dehydrogenase
MRKMKLAVIGLGRRGSGLLNDYLMKQKDIEITYVCDLHRDRVDAAAEKIAKEKGDKTKSATNYLEVLKSDTQAVVIATSWDNHVEAAIDSLRAGKITGMEVGGAYAAEDCWRLVRAYEETKTPFMFLENCCYDRDEVLALKLARAGLLGEIVHCSGAYSHDLRHEIVNGRENRHYRLDNYIKGNSENYPTHELGPIAKILDINRGNRMSSLVSMSSKPSGLERYIEKNKSEINAELHCKRFNQGDIVHTLIKCANGETIALKLDTTLPVYYSRDFTVRGTDGMYKQEGNMVVIDGIDNESDFYNPADTLAKSLNNATHYEHLLPDIWRNMTDEQRKTGHGGMDGIMLREFINRAKDGGEMPIDVYDAASWMVVSALSADSIALGGTPIPIPDFTRGNWMTRKRKDVF